jgi:hypothetical protein
MMQTWLHAVSNFRQCDPRTRVSEHRFFSHSGTHFEPRQTISQVKRWRRSWGHPYCRKESREKRGLNTAK